MPFITFADIPPGDYRASQTHRRQNDGNAPKMRLEQGLLRQQQGILSCTS